MASPVARVFISGSSVQREYLKPFVTDLEALGFKVSASWLTSKDSSYTVTGQRWTELLMSDIVIVFDETAMCMVETGVARALGHTIVLIGIEPAGDDAILFMPDFEHYRTFDEARTKMFEDPRTLRLVRRKN